MMNSTKWGFGIEQSIVSADGDKGCDEGIPIHPELHINGESFSGP
jgi:hypothetical protein